LLRTNFSSLHSAIAALCLIATAAAGDEVYQDPAAFLQDTFSGAVPPPKVIWLIGAVKEDVETILGHESSELRVRYWIKNGRSAWILEEIGKEKPITTGIVIDKGKIERIKVLIFRESRGWEVRHAFFTDQFKGAQLQHDRELDHPIDNISGATLSVNALTKLARAALYLHHHVAP
jgi:FMN-binding protein